MGEDFKESLSEIFASLQKGEDEKEESMDEASVFPVTESSWFNYLDKKINDGFRGFCKRNNKENIIKFKESFLSALEGFKKGKEIERHSFTLNIKSDSGISYISFYLDSNSFEVTGGGNTDEELMGFQSYLGWMYSIGKNGLEDTEDVTFSDFDDVERYFIDSAAFINVSLPRELELITEDKSEAFSLNPFASYDEDDF